MAQHKETRIRYRYDDFVLKLCRTEMEYTVEAQAPDGTCKKRPFSALPTWSRDVTTFASYFQRQAEQAETGQVKAQIVANAEVKEFGGQLFNALFRGATLTLYRQSLQHVVEARNGIPIGGAGGLRIVLDLEHALDLTYIPWEFLYDAEKDKFLCLDPQTPLVRRLRLGARSFEITPPLLFLLFSTSRDGKIPLGKAQDEIAAIQKAFASLRSVKVEPHLAALSSDLLQQMKGGSHIVHLTCHGKDSWLAFNNTDLSAAQINQFLGINPALRLVAINACKAGQEVAKVLARNRIPAIIAMQFEITELAALAFAREFYESLAVGYSLETSLAFARLEMGTAIPNLESNEWAAPVLYLQAANSKEVLGDDFVPSETEKGKLDLALPSDAEQRHFHFLMEKGQDLYRQGKWREALALLEEAQRLWHPTYGDFKQDIDKDIQHCQLELEEKRYRSQIALSTMTLFEKAKICAEEEDWEKTLNLLRTIGLFGKIDKLRQSASGVDFKSLSLDLSGEMLELYRHADEAWNQVNQCWAHQIRLEALYRRAEEGWHKENWDDAITFFEGAAREVTALKARNAKVDDRYQDAETRALQSHRQKQSHQLYQHGTSLTEKGQWREAVHAFERIIELIPSFQDVEKRVKEARWERDLDDAYHRAMDAIRTKRWQSAISDLQTIPSGTRRYREAQLALKYTQGCFHIEQGEWAQAVEALDAVVRRRPDFEGDARQRYQEALFCRDLEARYQEGCRRMEAREWQKAKADLQWVKNEQRNREALVYPDVDQRLSRIEEEIFLAAQYQQAQRFLATENWERAISHLQTILNLDDDYRDAPELLEQTQARQGAETAYQRGVEATLNRDWPAAIQAFEDALRLQPDHEEARKRLKTAQHNQDLEDNYREGIAAYRRGGDNYNVTALEKAILYLEQVVRLDPEFRDAADRLKESQRLLETERNYQAAVQAEKAKEWPRAVEAWQRVADLALELGREYRDAASRLKRAIQHKELADLHHQAQTHRSNQDWAEEAAVLADLVARAAEYGLAPYEDAQAQLEEAKRRAKIAARFDDGLLCMRAERWDDAITMFREVIRLDPEHGPALVQLEEAERQTQLQAEYQAGMGAFQTRDWPTAIRYLKRVVEEDRDYKNAAAHLETARHQQKLADLYRRGMEHADRDEWDQAFAYFDDVKRDDPDYRDVQAQWRRAYEYKEINQLYQRARKLEDEGKLEEAIKYYDEVEKRRQNVQ